MSLNIVKREEKRRQVAQALNYQQGERLRQKHIEEFDQLLIHLRDYAKSHDIPEKPTLPKSLPMILNQESLKENLEYRHYIVRKNIDHGVETLLQCMRVKPSRYVGHFSSLLTQKTKTLSSLLGHLKEIG